MPCLADGKFGGNKMAWDDKTPTSVTQARLMHSSPDGVYSELKEYAAHQAADGYHVEELEQALLRRNHPLITLGLAQYGGSDKVVGAIFKQASGPTNDANYSKALRLAVLGNSILPRRQIMSHGVLGVVDDQEVVRLINCDVNADDDKAELHAILTNPRAKRLLGKLFLQEDPFEDVPQDKLIRAVFWSYNNPALNDDNSNEHGPDMYAWDVKKGIRRLLTILPVTEHAAWALFWVIKSLDPHNAGMFDGDPTTVIDRWRKLELTDDFKKYHDGDCHDLDFKQEFLCTIASLYYFYSVNNGIVYIGSANSPDVVLRCAHYVHAEMTPEQMQKAHNKDGDAFTIAALNNEALFWKRETRAKLEGLMRWRLIHRYRRRCEQIKMGKAAFDLTPVSEHGVALLEDEHPSGEQSRQANVETMLTAYARQLQGINKILKWLLILATITIVLLFWPPRW
jgi:hypothetical protein